jgi:uncharacterized membrane protein YagU involved in acid resistance
VSKDDKPPPETPEDEARRARLWAVLPRLILSAFAGGMLFMSLADRSRAFWDGVLTGVAVQVLIRIVIALVMQNRQDSPGGVILSLLTGAVVSGGVALLIAEDQLVSLILVGGLVAGLDSIVSWAIYPTRNRTPLEEEPPRDSKSDFVSGPEEADE